MNGKNESVITPAALSALMKGDIPNFLVASIPGGIEAQEAQGQKDFVESHSLPIDAPWDELNKMGVKQRKEVITGKDDLFVPCKLPKGWGVEPTDHPMWSELKDASGKVRASIFYKAAFYDRSAFLRIGS